MFVFVLLFWSAEVVSKRPRPYHKNRLPVRGVRRPHRHRRTYLDYFYVDFVSAGVVFYLDWHNASPFLFVLFFIFAARHVTLRCVPADWKHFLEWYSLPAVL